jgi:uncharacterized protein involved in exopolysaccharide biosynthesis
VLFRSLAGSSLGIKNPNDLYVGMLKSRTVADSLIARFKLQVRLETNTMVETRKALEKRVNISAGKDGIISIEVDDEDPQFAAELANAYVDELYKLTQTLAVTDAAQRRLFFEKQLKQSRDTLATAELAMKRTQEKTGLLQLDAQGQAMISALGEVRAQIAAREVQLSAMRSFATEQNPDYIRTQQELAGLKAQLAKLEKGGDADLLPTGKLPEAGLEYVRSLREMKYAETLFELMAKQYELARIDEAKDASLIQVLDKAVPPDRKSKPKRSLIVILTALAVGFMALLLAFVREALEKSRNDPVQAGRLAELRRLLKWR